MSPERHSDVRTMAPRASPLRCSAVPDGPGSSTPHFTPPLDGTETNIVFVFTINSWLLNILMEWSLLLTISPPPASGLQSSESWKTSSGALTGQMKRMVPMYGGGVESQSLRMEWMT
ncbi:uncharacterized protein LOC144219453 [Crocuta crocuta]